MVPFLGFFSVDLLVMDRRGDLVMGRQGDLVMDLQEDFEMDLY